VTRLAHAIPYTGDTERVTTWLNTVSVRFAVILKGDEC
jgi:hypothetical protein